MLRLIDELASKKPRPMRRSISHRPVIRLILALSLGLVIIYYIHHLIQSSSTTDSRDMELIRSFCGALQSEQPVPKSRETSVTEYNQAWHLKADYTPDHERIPDTVWKDLPVKGVLYMTVRNEDLQAVRATIRSLEDRYNYKFGYPWVLLSTHYLSPDFRKYVRKVTTSPVYFGKIDLDAWSAPNFIRVKDLELMLQQMENQGVENGNSLFYRERMRYNAGLYFHHPLFQDVEYSWRVEPGTHYSCDLQSDPFQRMKHGNKMLGFTLTQQQPPITMRNFWGIVEQFMQQFPDLNRPSNTTIRPWMKDAHGDYNFCHIWSTSEIVDLSFLRSWVYQAFFSFLDSSGGFFYERWGDGTVQTAAASLFLDKDKLLFLNDIGHTYSDVTHCPLSLRHMEHCSCEIASNFDFHPNSCTISLLQHIDNEAITEMTEFAYTYYSQPDRLESFASSFFPEKR